METSGGAQRFTHEQWPYEPRFKRVNGWRVHYIDEGTGDPVVLLHGDPAWGFLYRKFVAPLTAAGRRVIVPDMIGFGLSEKPRARTGAHPRRSHREPDGPAAAVGRAQRHHGLSRLGRPDRLGICIVQPRSRARPGHHEHVGMAVATCGIPEAPAHRHHFEQSTEPNPSEASS